MLRGFAAALAASIVVVTASAGTSRSATTAVPCDPAALQVAIYDANANPDPDTLTLAAGCTYETDLVAPGSGTSAPFTAFGTISSPVTINGNGAVLRGSDTCLDSIDPHRGFVNAIGTCIFPAFSVGVDDGIMIGQPRTGTLTLTGVTLRDWRASKTALYVSASSTLDLSGSTLADNANLLTDSRGNASSGGALFNRGTARIVNTTFTHNFAAFGNGAGHCRPENPIGFCDALGESDDSRPAGAGGDGGAIVNAGTMTITGSLFEDNHAGNGSSADLDLGRATYGEKGGSGGAIYNAGTLTVVRTTIRGNGAGDGGEGKHGGDGGSGGDGGGIYNGFELQVRDSLVEGNGSGWGADGGSAPERPATHVGDGGDGGDGGGIASTHNLTILRSTFRDNVAHGGGSGAHIALITQGDDGASGAGGAVASEQLDQPFAPQLSIANSTFFHNLAAYGNAIFSSGHSTITASTIVGNMPDPGDPEDSFYDDAANVGVGDINTFSAGGGVWLDAPGTLTQDLLAANGPRNCAGSNVANVPVGLIDRVLRLPDFVDGGGNVSIMESGLPGIPPPFSTELVDPEQEPTCPVSFAGSYEVHVLFPFLTDPFDRGTPDADLRDHDPAPMGGLASNGGPTPTFALLPGHPGIDAATCAVTTDQRFAPRPFGVRCDAGAFERGATPDTTPPTTTAARAPAANGAGWNKGDVTVTLTASDNAGGVGVESITYSTTGAQPIGPTTAPGSTAAVPVTQQGTTTLRFSATDVAGNVGAEKTLVVKIDRTAPVLTAPAEVEVDSTPAGTKAVTFSVTATDNLDPTPAVVCTPPSGSVFPIGQRTVTCTATDAAGNSAQRTFPVIVLDARPYNNLTCAGVYGAANVTGDVVVKKGAVCILLGTKIGRGLIVQAGGAVAGFGIRVAGAANLTKPAWFKFYDSTFVTALQATGTTGLPPSGRRVLGPPLLTANPVCRGGIGTSLQLSTNLTRLSVGGLDFCTAATITVGNAVQLTGNKGGIELRSVRGLLLQCNQNTPLPTGGGNVFTTRQGACGTA